jgi:hypothetical protein
MFESDTLSPEELALLKSIKSTPDYSSSEVRFYLSMKQKMHENTESTPV